MQNSQILPVKAAEAQTLSTQNPYLDWLGVQLVEWRDNYAEMHLPIVPNVLNRTGRVHGGVLCTVLDSVAGYSGCFRPAGEAVAHSVTLSLTTQFLDNAPGKLLVATGRTEKVGRTVFFARSEVWLDGEKLLASASGTFKYVRHRD